MDEQRFSVELTLEQGYQFTIDFRQPGVPDLLADEPAPLGQGAGPNAARLLAAAVGNCLGASLAYCLRRSRVPLKQLRTTVEGTLVRNEKGRLRIGKLRVRLAPELDADSGEKLDRCLELFEDFCLVTQSVRSGIAVAVEVVPAPVPVAT
jgi:organic hydroperoxide reductase OsmC/OhrA